ncbi:hypothetical protein EV196_106184 [Mariniflexile fucanivorans]|uniref:Uncharacterized protein n=1 Tax=Mariniflexile fucanivorans TaxID=264023 RepID=A0A4R1RG93_9FLAO|nr:hypothetical protein [Mariniflexile fucanivorans]TCL64993.1 hypothetical protein EV196_106184 [Mariniflexile fucanivorans]
MDKKQPLEKTKSKFLSQDKKSLIIGSIIATIIATTPYLFYLYESVPNEKVWNTFLFTYHSGFYENAQTSIWVLATKVIPLLLLIIWFFTCRHWWFHALLVPIVMYSYQISSTISSDLLYIDSNQLMYLIPIMAIIVPSIYLIRARIFNSINDANKSLEDLEEEFKMSPKSFWDKIKQYF